MARNHRSRHQAGASDFGRTDLSALAPDVLLGIWSAWMSGSEMAQQWMSPVRPWWQLPEVRAGDLLSAGAKQLTEDFAHDPLLKSIEREPVARRDPVGLGGNDCVKRCAQLVAHIGEE